MEVKGGFRSWSVNHLGSGNERPEKKAGPRERRQIEVGRMSCSFCTAMVEKAYERIEGVRGARVSLAHVEVLIEYDPERPSATELRDVVWGLGYTVGDPDDVKAYEQQQQKLRQKKGARSSPGRSWRSRRAS